GSLAGLVAVTPAAGDVLPLGAMVLGFGASLACYGAIALKDRLGYDDTLDVFGIHGVGGIVGALGLTFLLRDAPEAGIAGQLGHQTVGVLVAGVGSAVGSLVLLVVVEKTVGLRLDESGEFAGMDHELHGEHGYGLLNPN
ncbi:MAG: ammonia channel protein, partial [Planctomycetota bacterium]